MKRIFWIGTGTAPPTRTAQAEITLTPPATSGLETYTETAPFLMDTGIDYAIVTPRTTPETAGGTVPTPPDPTQWEVSVTPPAPAPERMQLIPGVNVAVSLLNAQGIYQTVWSFNTSDFGQPKTPVYARLAKPSEEGIFNTSRYLLATYDYLADLTGNQIGFRTPTP
jgi:hypothetical protein